MYKRHVLITMAAMLASQAALADAPEDAALEHARRVLSKTILIDGHNDLPWAVRGDKQAKGDVALYDLRNPVSGQTDIARLKRGELGGQFWSVYIPGEMSGGFARTQLEQIDIARRIIERYPERLSQRRHGR